MLLYKAYLRGTNLCCQTKESPMFYIDLLKQNVNTLVHNFAAFIRRWLWRIALVTSLPITGALGVVCGAYVGALPHMHNIYSASKLVYGESRGESKLGQKAAFASVVERIGSSQFPNTMHAVVFQPYSTTDELLQYNAMGDTIHEDLSDEDGQTILRRVTWWYIQYQIGIFQAPKEARGAHSYCTPEACKASIGYFGQFEHIGTIGNHQFYGGKASHAPKRSVRPLPRPAVPTPKTERFFGDEIERAVAIATSQ